MHMYHDTVNKCITEFHCLIWVSASTWTEVAHSQTSKVLFWPPSLYGAKISALLTAHQFFRAGFEVFHYLTFFFLKQPSVQFVKLHYYY